VQQCRIDHGAFLGSFFNDLMYIQISKNNKKILKRLTYHDNITT
jgi:hypothetical protein